LTGKPFTVAEVDRCNVFIFGKGDEFEGVVIRAEVQDAPARGDDGSPLPPVVVIPCPRCNQGLRIDGIKKRVMSQPLDPPRMLDLREIGFGIVKQTRVLTVGEEMRCSYVLSDAPCGAQFRITENVLHKLGARPGRR
jgi:hypothetical protein